MDATVICEMSKPSWPMGEHLMEDDLENHLKAWSFRLAQWLNIIQSPRRTSAGSNNVVRKFHLEYSSDTHWSREEFGEDESPP